MIMEKKLQQFLDICMEDARNRSSNIFHEYSSALKKDLEKHKTDARRQAAMQIQNEEEKIRRELNKELAIGQINSKRTISLRHDELKEKIFIEVKDLLEQKPLLGKTKLFFTWIRLILKKFIHYLFRTRLGYE